MKLDRDLWLTAHFSSKRKMPNWICPICQKGILQKDKESVNTFNTVETNKGAGLFYNSDALAQFTFSGYLKCNSCSERVMISGSGKYFDETMEWQVLAV